MTVVVTNRIPVAKGHEIDFEDRFRKRVHLVDKSPGFIRNEVHRPRGDRFDHDTGTFVDDPDANGFYEVKTWWRTMEDFVAWTRSQAFAEAHASRPPKEMFRGPSALDVHEVFLTTVSRNAENSPVLVHPTRCHRDDAQSLARALIGWRKAQDLRRTADAAFER